MSNTVVSMPVAIEQIAVVLRNMSPEDRKRLLELVPELRHELPFQPQRTVSQAQASVEAIRQELISGLEGQPLSDEEPFLGDLTLGEYLALPDIRRAQLWDEWSETANLSWEEIDVRSDALPAG